MTAESCALTFNIAAAILWGFHRLTPVTMVVGNTLKTAVVVTLFPITLFGALERLWVFEVVLLYVFLFPLASTIGTTDRETRHICRESLTQTISALALAQLIYASVVLHRQRQRCRDLRKKKAALNMTVNSSEAHIVPASRAIPAPFRSLSRGSSTAALGGFGRVEELLIRHARELESRAAVSLRTIRCHGCRIPLRYQAACARTLE
nr:hypothetical protein CFP56_04051 [Quercus suber]